MADLSPVGHDAVINALIDWGRSGLIPNTKVIKSDLIAGEISELVKRFILALSSICSLMSNQAILKNLI